MYGDLPFENTLPLSTAPVYTRLVSCVLFLMIMIMISTVRVYLDLLLVWQWHMTMQSLGAATLNEFKRTHKKSQTDMAAAAAAVAASPVVEAAEEAPSATARLDLLLDKKRNAVLGPSKISMAESRGERDYQVQ